MSLSHSLRPNSLKLLNNKLNFLFIHQEVDICDAD